MRTIIFMIILFTIPTMAIAQVALISDQDFFQFVLKNLGGGNGISSLGVTVLVAQLLVKIFETKVGALIGKWKFTVISLLTLLVGTLSFSMTTNVSITVAFFSSANLALFQVFINQAYKQFFVKVD